MAYHPIDNRRPYWFDPGTEPEDTWEKSAEGKRAIEERDRVMDELSRTADRTHGTGIISVPPPDQIDE